MCSSLYNKVFVIYVIPTSTLRHGFVWTSCGIAGKTVGQHFFFSVVQADGRLWV